MVTSKVQARKAEAPSLLGSSLRSWTVCYYYVPLVRASPFAQPILKEWGTRCHLLMRGAAKSHCQKAWTQKEHGGHYFKYYCATNFPSAPLIHVSFTCKFPKSHPIPASGSEPMTSCRSSSNNTDEATKEWLFGVATLNLELCELKTIIHPTDTQYTMERRG